MKRQDIAVRNADKASVKVFKGLFAHLRLSPPVKVCLEAVFALYFRLSPVKSLAA
jgi:hypothetical protein